MLTRMDESLRTRLGVATPWTNVYGLARSLLALATATTLAFTPAEYLFAPASGMPRGPYCTEGLSQVSVFCVGGTPRTGILISLVILLLVGIGWRPRITGVLHWWVSASVAVSATVVDGGDHIIAVLTFLLLPVTLTDPRRFHWQTGYSGFKMQRHDAALLDRLVAVSSLLVIRIQVAAIYLHSSVAKFGVEEWADGTAMYYWFNHATFGLPGWADPVLNPMLSNAAVVAAVTWGTIVLELALFAGLLLPRKSSRILLPLGIALHVSIAALLGLVSFGIAMIAALILFLRPPETAFSVAGPVQWVRKRIATREPFPQMGEVIPAAYAETPRWLLPYRPFLRTIVARRVR